MSLRRDRCMSNKKEAPQPTIKSADDLIIKDEAAKLGKVIPETKAEEPAAPPVEDKEPSVPEQKSDEPEVPEEETEGTEEKPEEVKEEETSESPNDEEVDEYGTKIGKKKSSEKLYTEEEVQNMIRDRLKRGKHSEQNPEVQQAAKDFTPDPESEESYEAQLEGFIEKTIDKIAKRASEKEWRQREEESQAEFEIKFNKGMAKYPDFAEVVRGKPISTAMMMAARAMKDPAAFLFAACKQHPKEIERIANIPDPYAQSLEMGRLEEKMKRSRTIPASPRPSQKVASDASDDMPQLSIDARIAQHAKTKFSRS